MIFHPAILALFAGSILGVAMLAYAAWIGWQILTGWELRSGSEKQLNLERKTYLASTLLTYVFIFQLFSLFLFAHAADDICHLFTGAMCAAGTLNINRWGYPTLVLKLLTFLLAGVWLILNKADRMGRDYPLTRYKYALILLLAPLILAETALQTAYFLGLEPDLITSCCGSLFGGGRETLLAQLASPQPAVMIPVFFALEVAVIALGLWHLARSGVQYLLAAASALALAAGLAAVVSFISVYIYQLPNHHCPFCILKAEYGRPGHLIYALILMGGLSGMGTGILQPFAGIESLRKSLPGIERALAGTTVACHTALTAWTAWLIAASNMRIIG